MKDFDRKMALRSFFAGGIRHFLYANMAVTSCKTEGYISTNYSRYENESKL